jgi:hypothetical protein
MIFNQWDDDETPKEALDFYKVCKGFISGNSLPELSVDQVVVIPKQRDFKKGLKSDVIDVR